MTFNQPAYLVLALFLIPGFLLIGALMGRLQNAAIDLFGRRQTLSRFSKFVPKRTTTLIFAVCSALLAISAAEPLLDSEEDAFTPTLNAVVVVDVSRSMLAEDGLSGKSRLESGIMAVENLFTAYPDGRFGLVIYTDQVFVYPPTFDHQSLTIVLRHILENYQVRGEGSEPLVALRDTGDLLEGLPYTVDTVFLISDGGISLEERYERPALFPVANKLRQLDVRLVTVGVGELVPSAIPVYAPDGALVGYHEYRGRVAYTALDEIPLKRFADATSGWYQRLESPDDLVQIAREKNLDSQPVAQDTSTNLVWLPAVIALLLVAVWLLLHPRTS